MKRSLFMFVSSMSLIVGSVYADCCNREVIFRGGSFVASRPNVIDNPFPPPTTLGVLDQYIFNADGTAYWQQSGFLNLPLTNGTDSAEVGTWKVKNGHLYLTTIGTNALPIPGGTDINISANTRVTQKFKIIDKNTLEVVRRAFIFIDTNERRPEDPNTPIISKTISTTNFKAHRVRVLTSDLK